MPPSVSSCPSCNSAVSAYDHYCGICGTVLAQLWWRAPSDDRWHEKNGYLAVREGAVSARLLLRNRGVAAAALVLRGEDIAQLPDWIDREKLVEQLYAIAPGDATETPIDIPLRVEALNRLFGPQDAAEAEAAVREAPLPFLTNLIELRDSTWSARPFRVTLLAARAPWAWPAASFYRFLPAERLRGEGLPHRIALHNETAETIDLTEVQVIDDPLLGTAGEQRLAAGAVLHPQLADAVEIPAGAVWEADLKLWLADTAVANPAWFAGLVEFTGASRESREPKVFRSRVQGCLGRGPTLEVLGRQPVLELELADTQVEQSFAIENPGAIPVKVLAIDILRGGEQPQDRITGRDWLSTSGIAAADLLQPGETRDLRLHIVPKNQPRGEFNQFESRRTVRILHDGVGATGCLDLTVIARFGKAQPMTIGIDFGTTNSVVCIRGGQDFSCPLMLERDPDQDRIRSLMCFNSLAPGGAEEFLFGDLAVNSASIRPENLVRSIKTVVARASQTRYVFYRSSDNWRKDRVIKSPQELLNLFIAELKRRAEANLPRLSEASMRGLRLSRDGRPLVDRAAFSHPVEISPAAQRALMDAAQAAGINEDFPDVAKFFAASCVDEATAAVLAYVEAQLKGTVAKAKPADKEFVLCLDIGGGTTDIAAVEVENLAALAAGQAPKVTVKLAAKTGTIFGGDDLDELLAREMLDQIEKQARDQGAPVRGDLVRDALRARSYVDLEQRFQERYGEAGRRGAWAAYQVATALLAEAESVKREFSRAGGAKGKPPQGDGAEVRRGVGASGWPRDDAGEAAKVTANYQIALQRGAFDKQVSTAIRGHLGLITSVIADAGWQNRDLTTLLFTGQTTRLPVIRKEIVSHLRGLRGKGADKLLCIEPDQGALDPKTCVAIGAAIWAESNRAGSWISIDNSYLKSLRFELKLKRGPRAFSVLPGLRRGDELPLEVTLPLEAGSDSLDLYRDGAQDAYVSFIFPALREAATVTLKIAGPSDFSVLIDGQWCQGTLSS